MAKLDPAISKALSIDPDTSIVSKYGGSDFAEIWKIQAKVEGEDKLFFLKTGTRKSAKVMFAGEHRSLNAIYDNVPSLCPKSYAHGALLLSPGFFLATDFLDMSSLSAAPGSGVSFASKLAKLHLTPAPIPEGASSPQFGFPEPTCCGPIEQPNNYSSSWADFFANQRLRAVLQAVQKKNGTEPSLAKLVERTASIIVPYLLHEGRLGGETGISPVVVHGDLWSGNHGRGSIGKGAIEEVVFDPSACYAHSEYELGIMVMFGGFDSKIMGEYHDIKAKDKPVEEYEDRLALYKLYHYLNHYAIFGGGHYRSSAEAIMEQLLTKYGNTIKA